MKVEEQRAVYTATQPTVPTECPIVPFEQVATPQSDRGKRIKQRDYLPEGRIPVIDQGQTPIGGYTNNDDFAFAGELPVVLFGDHTRAVKLVNHRFAVGADGIKIFRPAEGVRPKYLYYWMKSARITNRGYGRHYQYLRQLSVPLPPPNKQDEIVAEIEKQFSRLDEAVANLKRVKANLKRYKAAVLKAAVEGRLVETEAELARREGRSYETGVQLLQRILETRRSLWKGKGKYKEPAAPDTTDLPELPKGWVWASPDQLAEFADNSICAGPFGTIFKAKDFRPSGIPIIFLRHVAPGRYLNHKPGFMDGSKWQELFQPYSVYGGELLITKLGEPPGVCAIYPEGVGPAMVTPDVIKLSVNADVVLPRYLMHYFNSETARRFSIGAAFGTTRLRLTIPIFRGMPVPLPSFKEQQDIVTEIDRSFSLADKAEAQVNANLQRAERLRSAVLNKSFTIGI